MGTFRESEVEKEEKNLAKGLISCTKGFGHLNDGTAEP